MRHCRRLPPFRVHSPLSPFYSRHAQTSESGKRVEIFHYHYVWDGYFRSTWDKAKVLFKDIMVNPSADAAGGGGAEAGGGTKFVTVLREPVDHWLSYFYFYYEPEMKASPHSTVSVPCISSNRVVHFPQRCADPVGPP